MNYSLEDFNALPLPQKTIVSLLAILGSSIGKTKLMDVLRYLDVKIDDKYIDNKTHTVLLESMLKDELIETHIASGHHVQYKIKKEWRMEPIQGMLQDNSFKYFCNALKRSDLFAQITFSYYRFNLDEWMHQIRMLLLSGEKHYNIQRWIEKARYYIQEYQILASTAYAKALGPIYYAEWFEQLHPDVVENALEQLLSYLPYQSHSVQVVCDWTLAYIRKNSFHVITPELIFELANILLLCGRVDDALSLCQEEIHEDDLYSPVYGIVVKAAVYFLRDEQAKAIEFFEHGLKAIRQLKAFRNALIPGFCGYLYVLASMREDNPKIRKKAENYLTIVLKKTSALDYFIWIQLEALWQIQSGMANVGKTQSDNHALTDLFQAFLYHWTKIDATKESTLIKLYQNAEKTGFRFIALQSAALLGQKGKKEYADRALIMQQEADFVDWSDWFKCQEPWENQLSALIQLTMPKKSSTKAGTMAGKKRLCWKLVFDGRPSHDIQEKTILLIEPFEQKCNAKGIWSHSKFISLKQLQNKFDELNATVQDRKMMSATYATSSGYHSRPQLEIHTEKALLILAGHPFIFLTTYSDEYLEDENEMTSIELLTGAPQLIVQENKKTFDLRLDPVVSPNSEKSVLVIQETPLRFKVIELTDSVKQIASILGQKLKVPLQAKDKILKAIQSLSGAITIQSTLEGAANITQIPADGQLHIHLIPHGLGLKCQIWVRPLSDSGPYYSPGSGAESVIAEVNKKSVQARRNLVNEKKAASKLFIVCPIFEQAEHLHDQWIFEEPEDCLTLLMQLQETQAIEKNLVISWPEGEKFKVSRLVDSKKMSLIIKREQNWFEANGELKIDADRVFQLKQLLELVKNSPGRFIALEENSFLALTEEFHHRLKELASFSESGKGNKGARVHPLATNSLEDLANDVGKLKTDQSWKDQLERLSELENFVAPLPNTLQAELREYQLEGFQWLSRLAHWGVGACLADDMGLGKTIQALALLLSRAPKGPALVVAPTSVCTNWVSEIARFAPTLNVVLFGSGNREKSVSQLGALDLVIVSYGLFQQASELFAKTHWHTIILDEAQSIKNAQTKRAQAVMTLTANFRVIMTGTPLENHLGELWSLFRFINPGFLGSLEQFNQRFALPIERDKDVNERNRLRKLVHPFMLRRTKNKVLSELPPRIEILLPVELSSEEKALYEALRQTAIDNIAQIDETEGKKPLQILAEIMKLRQACCHPQLVAPELGLSGSKLAAFGELVEELLENNHKALVFSQFVGYLKIIRAYLDERGIRYQYLDGSTPMQERKKQVDAFQAGETDLFLISLKAGGTGLNLTAADYVIHMDPWWNPAVEDQAADRAHRMGQTRTVTIYRLVAKHTIEESIVNLHAHKRDLADSLLDGADLSGKMSASEMMRLLKEELG